MKPNSVDGEILDAGWQRPKIEETCNIQEFAHLGKTEICFSTPKHCGLGVTVLERVRCGHLDFRRLSHFCARHDYGCEQHTPEYRS